MSKANYSVIVDGYKYNAGDTLPDLGSWVCVKTSATGNIRQYAGLSTDIDKLPVYDDLGENSSAFCEDTSDVLFYSATSKQWYQA
ncbi:MAG: hypothetical protein K5895_11905 [Lachnospiraceae bacterium]|nr:hypothetical protein [Lachnospiraceae bacterium]